MKKLKIMILLISSMVLICFFVYFGCDTEALTEIKITLHDKQVEGDTIARIDLKVIRTEIIDVYDNKSIISEDIHEFNLLEITANNPVVLAHTQIEPGIYSQIRLILDDSTTITLTNGEVHPLRTPSGQQTGIKIDGIFEIPRGKFYTLDIDMDPGHSVHYAPGQGYMLKPVIVLNGSDENSGNFFYEGSYNDKPFVVQLNLNGSCKAITADYPKYVVKGSYFYDSSDQTAVLNPSEITCPSCSWW